VAPAVFAALLFALHLRHHPRLASFLQDWLARQPAAGWPDLAGGGGELRLPLRQPLVNAAIDALVLPRVPALRRLSLAFHPQQRVDVVAASSASSRARSLPASR
jgi:hypothetical protein